MNDGVWFLHCLKTGKRFAGFSLKEARVFVFMLKKSRRLDFLAWREGGTDWVPLTEAKELLVGVQGSSHVQPPPLPKENDLLNNEMKKIYKDEITLDTHVDHLGESFEISEGGSKEFVVRYHSRHAKRLRVEIELQGQCFRTHTLNVSAGGAFLFDPLPDWVVGYCPIRLIREDTGEEKELTFSVVENQKPGARRRIQFTTSSEIDGFLDLEYWLDAA